jgi:hypothetical protein
VIAELIEGCVMKISRFTLAPKKMVKKEGVLEFLSGEINGRRSFKLLHRLPFENVCGKARLRSISYIGCFHGEKSVAQLKPVAGRLALSEMRR